MLTKEEEQVYKALQFTLNITKKIEIYHKTLRNIIYNNLINIKALKRNINK